MQPHDGSLRKFRLHPRYEHKRSEGVTRRKNSGSYLIIDTRKDKRK